MPYLNLFLVRVNMVVYTPMIWFVSGMYKTLQFVRLKGPVVDGTCCAWVEGFTLGGA